MSHEFEGKKKAGMYHRQAAIWTSVERVLDRDRTADKGDGTVDIHHLKHVSSDSNFARTYVQGQVMAWREHWREWDYPSPAQQVRTA
jgi:hypothetical protein